MVQQGARPAVVAVQLLVEEGALQVMAVIPSSMR